jgi:hypothetical protein
MPEHFFSHCSETKIKGRSENYQTLKKKKKNNHKFFEFISKVNHVHLERFTSIGPVLLCIYKHKSKSQVVL